MARETTLKRQFRRFFIPAIVINALAIMVILGIGQCLLIRAAEQQQFENIRNEFSRLTAIYTAQLQTIAASLSGNRKIQNAFLSTNSAEEKRVLWDETGDVLKALARRFNHPSMVFMSGTHLLFRAGEEPGALTIYAEAPVIATDGTKAGRIQVVLPMASLFAQIRRDIPKSDIVFVTPTPVGNAPAAAGANIDQVTPDYASSNTLKRYVMTHLAVLDRGNSGIVPLPGGQIDQVFTIDLRNADDKPIGTAVIGYDMTATIYTAAVVLVICLFTTVLIFLITGLGLNLFIDRRIRNPVMALSSRIRAISFGQNLQEAIIPIASDEIGGVQLAAERLRKTLVNLLRHINDAVR